jgi:hypothetical protein
MDLSTTFHGAWRHAVSPRQRRALVTALAALALIALLAAFVQVLRGAVVQGDQHWREQAVQADAVWRCKAQRGAGARRLSGLAAHTERSALRARAAVRRRRRGVRAGAQ